MRHFGPISGIATFKDTYVATAGYDNQVILWDARTRTPIQRVLHDHLANQCAFNAAGTLLVSASSDYTARVWEVPSLRLKTVLIGHDDDIEMAAFSPDGQTIATCSRDHSIRLFNLSGQTLRILHGHTADVISVCWSADGQTLVSSSDDGSIRRWDANTGQQLETIDLGGVETDTVALSREGIIFAGDDEGKISIISPRGTLLQPAHSAGIKRIIWDDSQRLLISLSYDRSVMLWHLKQDGTLVKTAETSLPSIIWPRSCALLGSHRIAFVTFGSRYATWDFATQTWDLSGIEPAVSLNAVAVVGRRLQHRRRRHPAHQRPTQHQGRQPVQLPPALWRQCVDRRPDGHGVRRPHRRHPVPAPLAPELRHHLHQGRCLARSYRHLHRRSADLLPGPAAAALRHPGAHA